MARITVEDCLVQIPNRFQLVLAATYRARMLSQGHAPKVDCKNKPAVTALREIAAGKIGLEMLKKVPLERLLVDAQKAPSAVLFYWGAAKRWRRAIFKG